MQKLITIALLTMTIPALAQDKPAEKMITWNGDTVNGKPTQKYVEEMPVCSVDMPKFLGDNLHYPKAARRKGIQGKVQVNFSVNEDGSISDVRVLKGIGHGCDEEAVRVMKLMPPWKPGTQNGKPVKVRYSQVITFSL